MFDIKPSPTHTIIDLGDTLTLHQRLTATTERPEPGQL